MKNMDLLMTVRIFCMDFDKSFCGLFFKEIELTSNIYTITYVSFSFQNCTHMHRNLLKLMRVVSLPV